MFGRSRNTRRLFFCIQARKPPIVKSFGRRQVSESRRGTNPRYAGRGLWCEPASKRAPIATRRNPLKRQSKFTSVRGPCSMQPGTILVTSFCDESIYWASPTQEVQFGAISHLGQHRANFVGCALPYPCEYGRQAARKCGQELPGTERGHRRDTAGTPARTGAVSSRLRG
jgi:hypothetical protein